MVGLKKITAAMAAAILSAAAFGNEGALLSESDLGWTANSSYPHAERIRARAMAQRFGIAAEQTALGFKDNIAADISDGGIIGDWHPVDNGFRLSFGAVHPGDSPRGGNSAGDENFKPYIGLGWGGQTRRGIGFNIDVGALYRPGTDGIISGGCGDFADDGDDASSFNCPSAISPAGFADLEEEFDKSKWHPLFAVEFEYRF